MRGKTNGYIKKDLGLTNLSSYRTFIKYGNTPSSKLLDIALGKNDNGVISNLGHSLGMYAKYFDPSIDIETSFPGLFEYNSLDSMPKELIDALLANEHIRNLFICSPYTKEKFDLYGTEEQEVHYQMLYYYGDQCTDITGGWTKSGYANDANASLQTASYNSGATFNDDHFNISVQNKACDYGIVGSVNPIKTKGWDYVFATTYNNTSMINHSIGFVDNKIANSTSTAENKCTMAISTDLGHTKTGLHFGISRITVDPSVTVYSRVRVYYANSNSVSAAQSMDVYCVGMTKADDYKTLCSKAGISVPSSMEELIADTSALTAIFNSRDAVEFAAKKCTGDFMIRIVNNEAAVEILQSSPYYWTVFIDNPHWKQFLPEHSYGDGSLNTVSLGYEGHLAINGEPAYVATGCITNNNCTNYRTGYGSSGSNTNIGNTSLDQLFNGGSNVSWAPTYGKIVSLNLANNKYNGSGDEQKFNSGSNTASFTQVITGEKTIRFGIHCGNLTGSNTISALKFNVDDSYYTLEEMVNKKFIKPLVLIDGSYTSTSYYFPNSVNLYAGGATGSGSWANLTIWFMTNVGYEFKGVQFTASTTSAAGDGWRATMQDTENFRMTYIE